MDYIVLLGYFTQTRNAARCSLREHLSYIIIQKTDPVTIFDNPKPQLFQLQHPTELLLILTTLCFGVSWGFEHFIGKPTHEIS